MNGGGRVPERSDRKRGLCAHHRVKIGEGRLDYGRGIGFFRDPERLESAESNVLRFIRKTVFERFEHYLEGDLTKLKD